VADAAVFPNEDRKNMEVVRSGLLKNAHIALERVNRRILRDTYLTARITALPEKSGAKKSENAFVFILANFRENGGACQPYL
jgi:hypothetical protein